MGLLPSTVIRRPLRAYHTKHQTSRELILIDHLKSAVFGDRSKSPTEFGILSEDTAKSQLIKAHFRKSRSTAQKGQKYNFCFIFQRRGHVLQLKKDKLSSEKIRPRIRLFRNFTNLVDLKILNVNKILHQNSRWRVAMADSRLWLTGSKIRSVGDQISQMPSFSDKSFDKIHILSNCFKIGQTSECWLRLKLQNYYWRNKNSAITFQGRKTPRHNLHS